MTGVEVYGPEAVRRAVGFPELIEPVARVLGEYSQGVGGAPQHVFAPAGADGDVHVKSAWLPGHPVFTVKVAGWFAARAATGRGPASGFVAVHSATTGDLLALLDDEHHLSDVRTAAAGAVAPACWPATTPASSPSSAPAPRPTSRPWPPTRYAPSARSASGAATPPPPAPSPPPSPPAFPARWCVSSVIRSVRCGVPIWW